MRNAGMRWDRQPPGAAGAFSCRHAYAPRYLERSEAEETLKKVHRPCAATAFASNVLPVPGGPNRSTPRHGSRMPVSVGVPASIGERERSQSDGWGGEAMPTTAATCPPYPSRPSALQPPAQPPIEQTPTDGEAREKARQKKKRPPGAVQFRRSEPPHAGAAPVK
eukprot:scaffold1691_cov107-Isochrysis_galbana.AAC.16